MPKYFEYEDPQMAAHVDRMIAEAQDAEENETIVKDHQKRPKEYAINNREKAFAPMTADDIKHRYTLAQGGGKDNFSVAEHRAEQEKVLAEYDSMSISRDIEGNFHVTLAQTAKIAQVVKDEKARERESLGLLKRIALALSFSKQAKKKRADEKEDIKLLIKAIEEGKKS